MNGRSHPCVDDIARRGAQHPSNTYIRVWPSLVNDLQEGGTFSLFSASSPSFAPAKSAGRFHVRIYTQLLYIPIYIPDIYRLSATIFARVI